MKKGFTLLELIVVIIIIGILGTLGFTQYSKVIERGRSAEARAILGTLRTAENAYFLDKGNYTASLTGLAVDVGSATVCDATNTANYFMYGLTAPTNTTFNATATRCTTGGKSPVGTTAYTITIDQAGNWTGI